jgi:Nuclease-related domain
MPLSMGIEERYAVTIDETLAGRRAGGSARAKAGELFRRDPWTAIAGVLTGTRTEWRAWRRGGSGERVAGWFLNGRREGWYTFHDVPVGTRGANIDHLVIAPSGVFTVNTKNLKGTIRVGETEIRHAGHRRDYYPKARAEAERAARLLGAALGSPVTVRPVLTILADDWRVDGLPADIFVGSPAATRGWIRSQPGVLSRGAMTAIAGAAHRPVTWRDRPSVGSTCACGGTVVERRRRSDGDPFLGCDRFPACRRTWPHA